MSAETLAWARDQLSKRGVNTRVVFLLRDPVERILSQQRMKLRKRGELRPELERDHLLYASQKLKQQSSQRSDYLHTLKALQTAFSPDELFIDLYERLFTEPIFRRLCQHLMIDYLEPNWSQRVNESRSTTDLPEEIFANIGLNQAEIYQGVTKLLPELNLATHWPLANRWCR